MLTFLTRYRQAIFFLCPGIAALFFSIREIYSPDIGFHLQAGRWIVENLAFPGKDTFTYTASGNDYIDLYWLYQMINYGVYLFGNSAGIIALNSAFILATLLIVFRRAGINTTYSASYLLLAIIALSPIFEIRPHSLSWLLLSISLFILQKYYDGDEKIIRWLPLIMLVWVNSHSLFILGWIVTGCYVVSVFFNQKKRLNIFMIYSSLSILICFVNPYGWKGILLPFEQMSALQSGSIFKDYIREFQSPFSITSYSFSTLLQDWHFFDLFVLFTALILFICRKKIRLHEWLIAGLFFYVACIASKNIGYFIFAVLPFAAGNAGGQKHYGSFSKAGIAAIIAASLLLTALVRTNAFYIYYRSIYRFGWEWSTVDLPLKAAKFIRENKINGRLLNQLNHGGYLEFFTDLKTSIDGRLEVMDREVFSEFGLTGNDEKRFFLIRKYKPDIILFPYFQNPDWLGFMLKQPGWRLVHADENSALYLRNGYAEHIPAYSRSEMVKGIPEFTNNAIDGMLRKGKGSGFLSPVFTRQRYPSAAFNRFLFCSYYGWIDEAKQVLAGGITEASLDYPELYLNFGTLYFQEKDASRSLYCYEKYLSSEKNEAVEERVRFLKGMMRK